jgi:hypothetical protein
VQAAIAMNPMDEELQFLLGALYVNTRNKDAALAQQTKVAKMNPDLGRKLYQAIYSDKLLVIGFDQQQDR